MLGIGHLLSWIVAGGFVGWIVSLIMGEKFKGGPLTYIVVGIVVLVALGLLGSLLELAWLVFVLGVVIIGIAGLLKVIGIL